MKDQNLSIRLVAIQLFKFLLLTMGPAKKTRDSLGGSYHKPFRILQSLSTYSHTWMWSRANKYVDEGMKKDMGTVKEYGERQRYKKLTRAKWECDEDYAGTMTAAAGYLLKSKGAYRGPIEDGYVYMLITDIRWTDDKH